MPQPPSPPFQPSSGSPWRELLDAPDRDHVPGCRPVLAYRHGDDPAYLAALDARAVARVVLERRGLHHGEWVELPELEAPRSPWPLAAELHQRWHAARPILLRGCLDPARAAEDLVERRRLFDELAEPGGLRAFLRARRAELEPHFEVGAARAPLSDPERDLERVPITWSAAPARPDAPRVKDLWVKSGWLSTHEEDRSLRLRVSFGREGADDASRDVRRHLRVAELAEALLPECALLADHEELAERLTTFVGGPTFLTQHIAYWNAPGGGALFHHDAFDEGPLGGQRGVVYAQLSGRTAWLALAIDDLAARVAEFAEALEAGELDWVRAALFPRPADFARHLALVADPGRVRRELARPGCGSLGPLVNRGPEFTALCADAGHALVLGPGDVLLLPNHGLRRTCVHSVFCASDEPTYGLSCAVRELEPPEPEPSGEDGPAAEEAPERGPSLRRQRASRRRRRR